MSGRAVAGGMGPIGPMGDGGSGEAVQVVVRCRPMSRKEAAQGHTPIIDMWPQRGIVHITNPRRPGGPWRSGSARMFTFDSVYDWDSSQDDLYENTVRPLVFSVLDGYNGTIFAYGQTGTGKTYTMLGSQEQGQQQQASRERGIASKCFEDVFRHIGYTSDHTSYVVRASYLEIYQEETRDLLAADEGRRPPALPLGEDAARGVYVKGLRSVVCKNIKAIERVMRTGNLNRATAATNMNEHSSRSHAIFQVTVEMKDVRRAGRAGRVRVGKLNLVDLAGSERQCKTGAVGDRLKESGKINLSLSALGNVISALTAADGGGRAGGNRHIPYRDSKLTQLLQDSLGGNAKAIMIANIGPASYNYDESLMTLRYASRAKHIKNRPTRNVNALAPRGPRPTPRPAPRPAPRSALTHYNEEMRALQDLILVEGGGGAAGAGGGRGDAGPTTSSSSSTDSSGGGGGDRGGRRRHHPRLGRSPRARSIRRHHRRGVWRLHGKRHQETTVQMVRWIQDQMGARGDSRSEATAPVPAAAPAATPAAAPDKSSLARAEVAMQKLADDLSEDLADTIRKEGMLLSIARMEDDSDRQTLVARAFLRLAAELDCIRRDSEAKHQQQRSQLQSEEARLRKALALKSAVFRAYVAECEGLPIYAAAAPRDATAAESLLDRCQIPTLVS